MNVFEFNGKNVLPSLHRVKINETTCNNYDPV